MPAFMILLFLATPFIEIGLFIAVGRWLGVLPTIGLTLLTSVAGMTIVQNQGLSNLTNMQSTIARKELPLSQIIHAVFLTLAGLFLLLPGFFTDFLGILLLIPPLRSFVGQRLLSNMRMTVHGQGGATFHSQGPFSQNSTGHSTEEGVVDAEFWEESSEKPRGANPYLPGQAPRLPPKAND